MALIPKENLIKASNLMFISACISLVTFIVLLCSSVPVSVTSSVVSLCVLLILAFFVRGGFEWARYLFALLVIIGVLFSPGVAFALAAYPVMLIVYTMQVIMHIYAAILMFRKRESGYSS